MSIKSFVEEIKEDNVLDEIDFEEDEFELDESSIEIDQNKTDDIKTNISNVLREIEELKDSNYFYLRLKKEIKESLEKNEELKEKMIKLILLETINKTSDELSKKFLRVFEDEISEDDLRYQIKKLFKKKFFF